MKIELVWEGFKMNLKHLFRKVITFYFSLKDSVPQITVLYININIPWKPTVCSLSHDGIGGGIYSCSQQMSANYVFLRTGVFLPSAGIHLASVVI